MSDIVKSEEIFDLVLDVVREQVGRGKDFLETLSKTLGVQAEYHVSKILGVVYYKQHYLGTI